MSYLIHDVMSSICQSPGRMDARTRAATASPVVDIHTILEMWKTNSVIIFLFVIRCKSLLYYQNREEISRLFY